MSRPARAPRSPLPSRTSDEPTSVVRFADGDHQLRVLRWERGLPHTAVLVHGIGMGQQYFGNLRDALDERVNVSVVELPGFGETPEPRVSLTMPALADLLADCLLANYAAPVVLVGHSMGTQVAAELAARHPELVDQLVLIAPTVNRAERTIPRQIFRMLQDLWGEQPRVVLLGTALYLKAGPRWFVKKLRGMMRHRIEDVLPRVQAPTLVIRGELDRVCPRDWVSWVTDLVPGAIMREAPGRGHEAMVTAAQPVSDMIVAAVRERGGER